VGVAVGGVNLEEINRGGGQVIDVRIVILNRKRGRSTIELRWHDGITDREVHGHRRASAVRFSEDSSRGYLLSPLRHQEVLHGGRRCNEA
jgi:hypothetical protein